MKANNGWIKLHRVITEHWISQNPVFFYRWIVILLNVDHKPNRVLIGDKMYHTKPGQSFKSVERWAELFGCSKNAAYRFLRVTEENGLIQRKTIGSGNRRKSLLTVVNWAKYQSSVTENGTENGTEEGSLTRMFKNEKKEVRRKLKKL